MGTPHPIGGVLIGFWRRYVDFEICFGEVNFGFSG